ncbi:hypothetical protein KAR91_18835 [Candidatus Pacearchaeota archaeon]|nr:hypothetical protein [Candidatus Pacearchaeota archaeon]
MSQTPEGKVKDAIKKLLLSFNIIPAKDAGTPAMEQGTGWYYMPTQGGLGVNGIADFIGHYHGVFWAVEAKAPDKEPSGFQQLQIDAIKDSGAAVFVVDGDMTELTAWLEGV